MSTNITQAQSRSAGLTGTPAQSEPAAVTTLAKGKTEMLVKPTTTTWVSDTATFSHDGKTLTVARTDYNEPPSRFGITIDVNGVARTLCPQSGGRRNVPFGPAEGVRYYTSWAKTPVRPGDRVTVSDPERNATSTVVIG